MANKGNKKGADAEESMRRAFQKLGYFVVRGIVYTYREQPVTDIDLWLYTAAGVNRERLNVDIKNRQSPKAFDRILWTLGVKALLRLDNCIVVTTATDPAISDFGRRSGVTIINGDYLKNTLTDAVTNRISEEEFCYQIWTQEAEEKGKELTRRYECSKRRLLTHLNYDGVNQCLSDIRLCMTDLTAYPGLSQAIRRVLYALISHLLVTIDYILSETQFVTEEERRAELEAGIRYGSGGRSKNNEFVAMLRKIKAPDNPVFSETVSRIADEFQSGPNRIPADIVSEYITKQTAPNRLFVLATLFEEQAFTDACCPVTTLDTGLKSLILVLMDYFGLDRRDATTW